MRTSGEKTVRRAGVAPVAEFNVGSRVVYPSHGVAEVVRREQRVFKGETCSYLVLVLVQPSWGMSGGLILSVPEADAAAIGVRAAMSEDEAADVLEVLAVRDPHMPANWSRRLKNHQEKLKAGDAYQCAEVVRNLACRLRQTRLSAAERGMYARARHVLTAELALSWNVDVVAANVRVDDALGLGDAAPRR